MARNANLEPSGTTASSFISLKMDAPPWVTRWFHHLAQSHCSTVNKVGLAKLIGLAGETNVQVIKFFISFYCWVWQGFKWWCARSLQFWRLWSYLSAISHDIKKRDHNLKSCVFEFYLFSFHLCSESRVKNRRNWMFFPTRFSSRLSLAVAEPSVIHLILFCFR